MDLLAKLTILADSAKYDAACTSSGAKRPVPKNGIGSTVTAGCCHTFSADGRCVSLLKVLLSNECVYNCKYCVNRSGNDVPRATFTPEELAELTIEFYRRNYIEGLFLSSGVLKNPDYTMEQMIRTLEILRHRYHFWGYIHAKTIPGAHGDLVYRLGLLADRLSVNIELPSENSLKLLALHKSKRAILTPMGQISQNRQANSKEIVQYKHAPRFATAGQATQMIIGASPESDYQILRLAASLYDHYQLKRVFYSAYIPAVDDRLLPAIDTKPPLLREHRLYQADWLMREYAFDADEILSERTPNFNPYLDPKCNWAIHNLERFPLDVNRADQTTLLRVPGIGPTSARRIISARRHGKLRLEDLKRIGVVLKRARYFIITADSVPHRRPLAETIVRALIDPHVYDSGMEQLTLFDNAVEGLPGPGDVASVTESVEEAVTCLANRIR